MAGTNDDANMPNFANLMNLFQGMATSNQEFQRTQNQQVTQMVQAWQRSWSA